MTAPSLQQYIQGQGAVSADNLNTFEQTCDSIAQLRTFIGLPGIQVFVRGTATVNDGGGGPFFWSATSTAADNGSTVVRPVGVVVGAWLRLTIAASFTGGSPQNITNIASLRASLSGSPVVFVEGYYAGADGGEGMFWLNPNDTTSADNGGTIIIDTLSNRYYRETGGMPYSVKWFGAKGDGVHDDTANVQQTLTSAIALNSGSAYAPGGSYLLTATISVVGAAKFALMGDGFFSTVFTRATDYGDTFFFSGIQQFDMRHFSALCTTEMTKGAHLHFSACFNGLVSQIWAREGYINYLVAASGAIDFIEIWGQGGDFFTDAFFKAGSANFKLEASGVTSNSAIKVINTNFFSAQPVNTPKLQFSMLIEACDELQLTNVSASGGHDAQLQFAPVAGFALDSVLASNMFLDFAAVNSLTMTGSTPCGPFNFSNCTFQGATSNAAILNSTAALFTSFSNCNFIGASQAGLRILNQRFIALTGCTFGNNNTSGTAGVNTINISEVSSSIIAMSGCIISGDNVATTMSLTGVGNASLTGNVFTGGRTVGDIVLASPGTMSVANNVSDNFSTVASAATLPIGNTIADLITVTGTTTITAIAASWPGRRITLNFTGAVTVTGGANLSIQGGTFSSATSFTLSLLCTTGTSWSEIGRG